MYEIKNALLRAQIRHAEAKEGTPEHEEAEDEIRFAERDWDALCRSLDKKEGGWEGK